MQVDDMMVQFEFPPWLLLKKYENPNSLNP